MSRVEGRRARAAALLLALVVGGGGALAVGALAGCHTEDRRVVDERLLLALEEARALQHRADVHLEGGDVVAASADVRAVLEITFPTGAPEGEETRLDAWARLGRLALALGAGHEDEALAAVDSGRREASFDSFYRAHLDTVAGEILEARARRIAASDPEGAKVARRDAVAAYSRSIDINKRVQARLLGKKP